MLHGQCRAVPVRIGAPHILKQDEPVVAWYKACPSLACNLTTAVQALQSINLWLIVCHVLVLGPVMMDAYLDQKDDFGPIFDITIKPAVVSEPVLYVLCDPGGVLK